MRLEYIEQHRTLGDTDIGIKPTTPLSNSNTNRHIEHWYQRARTDAVSPYWLADETITDWQASFADWLSSITVPKLQMLDAKWRSYAMTLHYIHYLQSQEVHLASQAAQIDAARASTKLELADAQRKAEQMLGGSKHNNKEDNE